MRVLRELGRRTFSSNAPGASWTDTAAPLFSEHLIFPAGKSGGEGPPRLAVILHGLLGTGRNLRGFTTQLFQQVAAASDSQWIAVLVDLRNHGKSAALPYSEGLSPPHTLHAAAQDVIQTVANNWSANGGRIDALIGHSLGGKVALEVTRQLGKEKSSSCRDDSGSLPLPPRQVWCLDSVPGKVPDPVTGTSGEVLNVLRTVSEIPTPLASREVLFAELEKRGHHDKAFQQWLATNLKMQGKNEYVWSFNVTGAEAMFDSYRNSEYWDVLGDPPGTDIHFVKAMKGGRWAGPMAQKLDEMAAASSSSLSVHAMENAGHWLHAEDPKGLAALMKPFIQKL